MKGVFCEATILKLSIEINFHATQWNPTNLRPNWEFFVAAISQNTSPSFSFRKPEKFLWNHTDIKIWTQSDRLELHSLNLYLNKYSCRYVRVDMVGTNHDKVLTQWRHMPMGQFHANIFLIRITSTYFWASEVFKNQSFKSQLFSSSLKKIPQIEITA